MLGTQEHAISYHCGLAGGMSSRGDLLPAICPTSYQSIWDPSQRFWYERSREWLRRPLPPVAQA